MLRVSLAAREWRRERVRCFLSGEILRRESGPRWASWARRPRDVAVFGQPQCVFCSVLFPSVCCRSFLSLPSLPPTPPPPPPHPGGRLTASC